MIATLVILSWFISGAVAAKLWLPNPNPVTWNRVLVITSGAIVGYATVFVVLVTLLIDAKFWDKPVWPR